MDSCICGLVSPNFAKRCLYEVELVVVIWIFFPQWSYRFDPANLFACIILDIFVSSGGTVLFCHLCFTLELGRKLLELQCFHDVASTVSLLCAIGLHLL
ncbi:hypothetical protein GJAV_G00122540 [Gymnothorax javanicus]|nr:hypothetical protein GJAV_G00122540 [Gymnothorax javanicus]